MSPGSVMFVEKCSGRPQSNALYCQALLMVRLAQAQLNSSWLVKSFEVCCEVVAVVPCEVVERSVALNGKCCVQVVVCFS